MDFLHRNMLLTTLLLLTAFMRFTPSDGMVALNTSWPHPTLTLRIPKDFPPATAIVSLPIIIPPELHYPSTPPRSLKQKMSYRTDDASPSARRQRLKRRSLQPISDDESPDPKPKNRFFSLISSLGSYQGEVTPSSSRANTPLGKGRASRQRKGGGGPDKILGDRRPKNSGDSDARSGWTSSQYGNDRRDTAPEGEQHTIAQARSSVEFVPHSRASRPRSLKNEVFGQPPSKMEGPRYDVFRDPNLESNLGAQLVSPQDWASSRPSVDYTSLVKVVNPNGVFVLQIEGGMLSLQLAKTLKPTDYRRNGVNELRAQLYYTLPAGTTPSDQLTPGTTSPEQGSTFTLLTIVLVIVDTFACISQNMDLCYVPQEPFLLQQWENRPPSFLLQLPSPATTCSNLFTNISLQRVPASSGSSSRVLTSDALSSSTSSRVSLSLLSSLDREELDSLQRYSLHCHLQDKKETWSRVDAEWDVQLNILDEDDSPPVRYKPSAVAWHVDDNPRELDNLLTVLDADVFNDYHVHTEGGVPGVVLLDSINEFNINNVHCRNASSALVGGAFHASCTFISPVPDKTTYNVTLLLGSSTSLEEDVAGQDVAAGASVSDEQLRELLRARASVTAAVNSVM
ncbi:uncharacterized protein LOC125179062 [Hyalella azteca]|uniref:Uncharacterized protein LOC125179062 n=1 Tax=Hyalella azteca TaxID=294128 RepID=A0A979FSJ3_HYAAZ|nr:uncharacterized protein LOC125179062 [Hyalella azteca]